MPITSKMKSIPLAIGFALAAPCIASAQNVTIIRETESNNYDPQKTTALAAAEVLFMLGDTLVSMDREMKTIKPSLAKSWTMSDDGKTYTFQLRDDVTFCDGKKFTAEDAAFTINRLADPATASPAAWRAGNIDSVKATGPYTLEYKLKAPFSELLYQLTQSFATVIDSENLRALGTNFGVSGLNTTGPFCWGEWRPRDKLVMTKHKNYKWGPPIYENTGPAQVDSITWTIVPEANTRTTALLTGQADVSRSIPYLAFEQFRAMPTFEIRKSDIPAWTEFFGFKLDKPTVKDLAVRKAMNLAFDQKAMVQDLYFNEVVPATTYMSPTTRNWPAAANDILARKNVAEAKKMLDDAGWKVGSDGIRVKDGVRLAPKFYGFAGSINQARSEYLQAEMRKIGIDIQIQTFDPTIVWSKLATQEFDMFQIGFSYFSAADGLNLYFPSRNVPAPNRMNWKDPETDQWLEDAKAAVDPKVAEEAISKVVMKVENAATWLPIYHEPISIVQSKRLKSLTPYPIQGTAFYKGLDFAVAK